MTSACLTDRSCSLIPQQCQIQAFKTHTPYLSQAYNTLTDEVADKDLQFQQLRAAGTSEDEAAAHQRQELEQRLAGEE